MNYFSPDSGMIEHPKWKIQEPVAGRPYAKDEISGVLVPGLAFTTSGIRMGRGQGFYDRYLAGFKGQKVGVCFEVQIFSHLPTEAYDQKVDFILTEKRFIRASEGE
jgi:5-formyltetrahydrofolate cyclo-ligase